MLDPGLVDPVTQTLATPGVCFLCRSANGPFIDTRVTVPPLQRVYICAHTCGSQIADLCSSQIVEQLQSVCADFRAEVARLEGELERERANKVVPLQDVRRVVQAEQEAKRKKRRKKPAAA